MELLQLKYLCTAARFENFSRAAKFHNIPQSAISKTISQLERELGTQLFVRNGNRVTLNERGKRFCTEVGRALAILGDAAQEVKVREELCGEVCLLAEEHIGEAVELVSGFKKEHPEVKICILSHVGDCPEYDLRIAPRTALPDRQTAEKLKNATVHLLLPANHRLAGGAAVPLSALAGERLIIPTVPDAATGLAQEHLARVGLVLPEGICADDRAVRLSYIGGGLGIGFAAGLTPREAGDYGITAIPMRGDWEYPTCLSYRRSLSPAAAALHAVLLKGLGGLQ